MEMVRIIIRYAGRGAPKQKGNAMRFVFSYFSFFVTLVAGAVLFAFLAIEFPTITRQLMESAQTLPRHLSSLGLSDKYMIWIDILLTGEKLVLFGCILVMRLAVSLAGAAILPLTPGFRSGAGSTFEGWGR